MRFPGRTVWFLVSIAHLVLMAPGDNALGAAHLSGLLGHESPFDQADLLSPEYGGPSKVLSGLMNVDDSASSITVFLATFGGGLVGLHYSPTHGGNGLVDRAVVSGGDPVYALDVCGVNVTSTDYVDTIFEIAQDANLTAPHYSLHRLSANPTSTSYENGRSLPEQPLAMACKSSIGASSEPMVVFLAMSQGITGWDKTLSANDTVKTDFVPTALAYMGGVNVTGTDKDYLVAGGAGGEIVIYEVNATLIGDSNTTNAIASTGIETSINGVPRAITIYSSGDVDANDTSDEAFIFIGTDNDIFLFELDDNGSDPQKLVLEYKGNLTQKLGMLLNVKAIFLEPARDSTLRAGFLIAACGAKGTLFFKTGGDADTGSSATDSFSLQYLATFPTASQALKILGTGGIIDSNNIERVYCLDGGGLKVLKASSLSSPESATVSLDYEWSAPTAPEHVELYTVSEVEFGLLQTVAGEIRLYDLSPNVPALVLESSKNATGISLFTDSSLPSGQVSGMYAVQDPSHETTLHCFSGVSGAGIVYSRLDSVSSTAFTHASSASHVLTGEVWAIHGFLDGSGKFILGVARGDQGLLLVEFDPSTGSFEEKGVIVLGSSIESVFLVHAQSGYDYAYVGTGDGELLVFNITGASSAGSRDYLTNPELAASISPDSTNRTAIRKIMVRVQDGARYYAYLLGRNGHLYTVDVTNPLAPAFLGAFPGDDEDLPGDIRDFSIVEDQGTGRDYAICASSAQYSDDDGRRILFSINVDDPSSMLLGSKLPVDPSDPTYIPVAVAVEQSDVTSLRGFFGAGLGTSSYLGIVGSFDITLTGPQNIYASLSLESCPAEPGSTVYLTPSVTGGEAPYSYSWSVSDVEEMASGTLIWPVPDSPGTYQIVMTARDSDGNIGVAARECTVTYRGVSVETRIATPGSSVNVPIVISGIVNPIDAWGLEIRFDPNYVELLDVAGSDDTLGWSVSLEYKAPGIVRLGGVANGHSPIPPGVTAPLAELMFSVKDVSGYGTRSCLSEELFSSITPVALSPSELMVDLAGAGLHAGGIKVVLPGDVDADACVTPQDALNVFMGFLGTIDMRDDEKKVGDVDKDGMLSPNDAVMILDRYLR